MKYDDGALAALGHLSGKRPYVLLVSLRLGRFTSAQLWRAVSGDLPGLSRASLARDLRALEDAGLLAGDPAAATARRGQEIVYETTPLAESLFRRLDEQVRAALKGRNLRVDDRP